MEVLKVSSPDQLEVPLTGAWGGLGQRTVVVQFGQSLFCLTGVSYSATSRQTTSRDLAEGSTWLSSSKYWPGAHW